MHRIAKISISLIALTAFTAVMAGQNTAPPVNNGRKITSRVQPAYPELAKRMRLQGVVKVEAVVRANGSVKSTHVLGGNPVLVDSAADAVSKWKFEPGPGETTEIVQLTFVPQ
ncbi:MAG TPA: energy transducer TonB [Terriglobales bacterium]|nr:energy transducer TonB [Terriglobales bacterium]